MTNRLDRLDALVIEKGHPVPPDVKRRQTRWGDIWRKMEIGDSVFLPWDLVAEPPAFSIADRAAILAATVSHSLNAWRARHPDQTFVVAKEESGLRVFRIAGDKDAV
jgi:hypothetical protein